MKKSFRCKTIDRAPNIMQSRSFDNALTFLTGQLEFLDPVVKDPLHAESYAQHLFVKTGAGWVEGTSFINNKPVGGGNNQLSSNRANAIKRISADLSKTLTGVFTYKAAIEYQVEELNKAARAGVNIDNIFTVNLRLDYEKTVDLIAHCGMPQLGLPGLIGGRTGVTTYNVTAGAAGTRTWATKTPDEILADINTILLTFWQNTGYAAHANTIGLPPTQFAYIATKKIDSLGQRSILTYIMENNIATKAGVDLKIVPIKWCTPVTIEGQVYGGGLLGVDRMVAYINNEAYTRFHLPVPLTREDVTKIDLGISVPYIGLIGGVEVVHTETILYADGI